MTTAKKTAGAAAKKAAPRARRQAAPAQPAPPADQASNQAPAVPAPLVVRFDQTAPDGSTVTVHGLVIGEDGDQLVVAHVATPDVSHVDRKTATVLR